MNNNKVETTVRFVIKLPIFYAEKRTKTILLGVLFNDINISLLKKREINIPRSFPPGAGLRTKSRSEKTNSRGKKQGKTKGNKKAKPTACGTLPGGARPLRLRRLPNIIRDEHVAPSRTRPNRPIDLDPDNISDFFSRDRLIPARFCNIGIPTSERLHPPA